MRSLFVIFASVMFVVALTSAVNAEQPGEVSDAVLADLGLGGMERVSDAEGEQIRGKWYFDISIDVGTGTFSKALTRYFDLQDLNLAKSGNGTLSTAQVDLLQNGTYLGGTLADVYGVFAIPLGPENVVARSWREQILRVNSIYAKYYPKGIAGRYGPRALGLKPIW